LDEAGKPPEEPPRPPRPRAPLAARLLGAGARPAQRVAELTGVDRTLELAAEEAIVRAAESPAVERALVRVLQGPAVQEAVDGALSSPAVERAIADALDSELVDHVWDRLLDSDEVQRLIERIAEAPEIRAAIASQGVGLVSDLGTQLGRFAGRIDAVVERIVWRLTGRGRRETPARQAGVVSRLLALVIDGLLLNGGFLIVSAVIAALVSAFSSADDGASTPALVVGAGIWLTAGAVYLLAFWSMSGQTPGMRFIDITLDAEGSRRVGVRRAFRRLVGLVLSVVTLGIGFLLGLFSERRRDLADRISGTEVFYEVGGAAGRVKSLTRAETGPRAAAASRG
jgi:uncharacterized RDD family membrane protein YckC